MRVVNAGKKVDIGNISVVVREMGCHRKHRKSSKSGKASVENCSLSATPTAYNSILHFLQDLRGSSSAVGLLRLVLRSERRHQ